MNTTTATEKLVARRVRGGGNETDSRELLAHLVSTCGVNTLAHALHYNGFATEVTADRLAAQVAA